MEFLNEILSKYYDEETIKNIIDGLNEEKAVTLRVNTLKSNLEEVTKVFDENNIKYSKVEWYKDALIIENALEENLRALKLYEEGKIYLQSLSSMLPPLFLEPKENENILDMAAAPGGKTTEMAALSSNEAMITAVERNKIRGEKLKYNLDKQGATKVNVMLEDARNLNEFFSFDKILLDAPCSGSGTVNVFKNNFTMDLINKSAETQEILLRKAVKILKNGGTLVYSTCSILPRENEEIVEKILKENKDIKVEAINMDSSIPTLPVKIPGVLCVKPTKYFEGFFVAKLVKNVR